MLTYEEILDLMDRFEAGDLTVLELRQDDFRLRLEQGAGSNIPLTMRSGPSEPAPAASHTSSVEAPPTQGSGSVHASERDARPVGHCIESPIVGTFYAAPSPDAAPFVSVGDHVAKGQVICIVEAMKMMNEIEADAAGEVLEIVATNGEPIGHGDPILVLRADDDIAAG